MESTPRLSDLIVAVDDLLTELFSTRTRVKKDVRGVQVPQAAPELHELTLIAFMHVTPLQATLDGMGSESVSRSGGRQDRRKAATRAKILAAAEELFDERGYAETSIEDISESADVAVRTIYTHFPTKAAIMLAYFDRWVDAFSLEIQHRPVSEPVVESVREALLAMERAGWVDRVENEAVRIHPIAEHLDSGAPDIAGHILQRWMREMMVLAKDARNRGDYPDGSLEPQARATAVFASWIAAMSVARQRALAEGEVTIEQVDSAGLKVLSHLVTGHL